MRGMRSVKPEAEFISWTYGQRGWGMGSIQDSCRRRSKDVILMQNFEDWGETDQLGKTRLAIDYWLSYTGPGSIFQESVRIANSRGTHVRQAPGLLLPRGGLHSLCAGTRESSTKIQLPPRAQRHRRAPVLVLRQLPPPS